MEGEEEESEAIEKALLRLDQISRRGLDFERDIPEMLLVLERENEKLKRREREISNERIVSLLSSSKETLLERKKEIEREEEGKQSLLKTMGENEESLGILLPNLKELVHEHRLFSFTQYYLSLIERARSLSSSFDSLFPYLSYLFRGGEEEERKRERGGEESGRGGEEENEVLVPDFSLLMDQFKELMSIFSLFQFPELLQQQRDSKEQEKRRTKEEERENQKRNGMREENNLHGEKFVRQCVERTFSLLQQSLSLSLSFKLREMKWPPLSLKERERGEKESPYFDSSICEFFLFLLQLQVLVLRFNVLVPFRPFVVSSSFIEEKDPIFKISNTDIPEGIWAIEILLEPLIRRFVFHFFVNAQQQQQQQQGETPQALSMFGFCLEKIRLFSPLFMCEIQPLLQQSGMGTIDGKWELIGTYVGLLHKRLHMIFEQLYTLAPDFRSFTTNSITTPNSERLLERKTSSSSIEQEGMISDSERVSSPDSSSQQEERETYFRRLMDECFSLDKSLQKLYVYPPDSQRASGLQLLTTSLLQEEQEGEESSFKKRKGAHIRKKPSKYPVSAGAVLQNQEIACYWLWIEKKFAMAKTKENLEDSNAWESWASISSSTTSSSSFLDDLSSPLPSSEISICICVARTIAQLTASVQRLSTLPLKPIRTLFFASVIGPVLGKIHNSLQEVVQRATKVLAVDVSDPRISAICTCLNSVAQIEQTLTDWAEEPLYLLPEKTPEKTNEEEDDDDENWETYSKSFGSLGSKLTKGMAQVIAKRCQSLTRNYFKQIRWSEVEKRGKKILEGTSAFAEVVSFLQRVLPHLQRSLFPPLFLEAWRSIAKKIDQLLFKEIGHISQISLAGGQQMKYDFSLLIQTFSPYSAAPQLSFHSLSDCFIILCFTPESLQVFRDFIKGAIAHQQQFSQQNTTQGLKAQSLSEAMTEVLCGRFGIKHLDANQCLRISSLRSDKI